MIRTIKGARSLKSCVASTSHAARSPRAAALAAAAITAFGLLLSPAAARADHLDLTLGSSGQLYSIEAGTYGSLFGGAGIQPAVAGGAPPVAANTPVLALDTTLPGAAPQRQLVPSTEDPAADSSPALVYEDVSQTLFAVWVSSSDPTSSVLKLISYNGSQWSQPIEIISNPYATKTPPQVTLTHDTHTATDPASGAVTVHRRTVLHVVWSENSLSGLNQAFYAPVIFEDGVWIGTVPEPMLLNTYDAAAPAATAAATPLGNAPTVQGGRDVSTAITAFASDATGMVTEVELDFVPEELRDLANAVQSVVASSTNFPGQLTALASQAQTALQASGTAFQPEVLQGIAGDMQAQILSGATNQTTMAWKTRAVIIDSGVKFAARGLKVGQFIFGTPTVAPSQIVEIVPPNGGPSQLIQFRVASTRPAPAVGGANGVQLLVSPTGANLAATWQSADGSSAYYTNTQPDGTWSTTHQLQLSPNFNLQTALQVLQQRVN